MMAALHAVFCFARNGGMKMEDIRSFGTELKEEIMSVIPDDIRSGLTLKETEVTKINDQKLFGFMFQREGSDASPAIYLNQLYERFRNGETVKTLAGEMADLYLNSIMNQKEPEMPKELDFDDVKDNLTIRVVDISKNRDFLSEVPYMTLGNGLAAVCDIQLKQDLEGMWRTTVTRNLMEKQGYNKAELFSRAMETAREVDPPKFTSMGANLFGQGDLGNLLENDDPIDNDEKESMYVLTNESAMYGAAALFYPGMQEKIAEKLGEGYYALPSSLHEYIILPDSSEIDPKEMCEMVKMANKTVVEPKDVLSDNVLHFDKDTRQLDSVSDLLEQKPKEQEMRC